MLLKDRNDNFIIKSYRVTILLLRVIEFQPGIELTTIKSWVWHAHCSATRAGQQPLMWSQLCVVMYTMFCLYIINLKATLILTFDWLISKSIGIIYTPIQMSVPSLRKLGQFCVYLSEQGLVYSKTPLLRPPLVLLKFGLISGVVWFPGFTHLDF